MLTFIIISCLACLVECKVSVNENVINKPQIVIIGAGASGIAAASKLFENGLTNTILLETENRIGGRVYTTTFGNYTVDLGGQWVDGEEGNVAFEMAYPLGVLDKSDEPTFGLKQTYFDSRGHLLNDDLTKNLTNLFFDHIYAETFDNKTSYKSMGDYVEQLFDEYFKDNQQVMNEKKKYLQHLEQFTIGSIAAESWYDISVISNEQYKECSGDHLISWKDRGYSTILELLMKRFPNPENELPIRNNTILNSEVILIDYSKNNKDSSVVITTAQGEVYKADHVIVTVPLGVLKERHRSLFIPPLPANKIDVIEGLGFGIIAKIYLLFDKPFWQLGNTRILDLTFIWNDDDRKIIEDDPEKLWLLGLFSAVTVQHKPNLLQLWVTGKHAKLMEALPEDKVLNHALSNLHRFLDKTFNITKPVAMLRSQWFTNPHFRGTYTYRSLDTQKRQISPKMLEKPLTPQTLTILFAGEATSVDRYGTVDGAISSGWKAAEKIIEYYKNKSV